MIEDLRYWFARLDAWGQLLTFWLGDNVIVFFLMAYIIDPVADFFERLGKKIDKVGVKNKKPDSPTL